MSEASSRPLADPSYARLVLFAVLLGVGYGGFVALGPPLVAELFGVQGLGALLGVLYTSAALGSAVGPPLAGVLIGDGSGYGTTVVVTLVVAALSAALVQQVHRGNPAGRAGVQ